MAKNTAKHQLMLPRAFTPAEGRIVPPPGPLKRNDALRAKLAALKLNAADVDAAVAWARR